MENFELYYQENWGELQYESLEMWSSLPFSKKKNENVSKNNG
jgi:hypothetical protein